MRLDEDGLVFNPSLELGPDYGFLMLIEGLINDIYTAAKLIPRLAKNRMSYKVSPGLTRPPLPPLQRLLRLPCSGRLPDAPPPHQDGKSVLLPRGLVVRSLLEVNPVSPSVLGHLDQHASLARTSSDPRCIKHLETRPSQSKNA